MNPRAGVEDLLSRLRPAPEGDRSFDNPWEIRAFAIAVAAHQAHQYEWNEFRDALIESIQTWENDAGAASRSWSYYEHWVNALETVLARSATVTAAVLDERTRDVLATPANRNHHAAHLDPIAIDPAAA
jgi:nitrile hydratase accessory protein